MSCLDLSSGFCQLADSFYPMYTYCGVIYFLDMLPECLRFFTNANIILQTLRYNDCLNGLDVSIIWHSTFLPYPKNCLDHFHAEGHKHINTSPDVPWGPGDIYKKEHPTVIQEADWTPFIFSNATVLLKLLYCSDVPVLPTIRDVSLIDGQALIWEWWELHLGIMRGDWG